MTTNTRHRASFCAIESLESRTHLSAAPAAWMDAAQAERSATVAAVHTPKPVTKTLLKAQAGTLDEPITFNVTVRAAAALGSPTGTVDITDENDNVFATLTLTPATSTHKKFAESTASFTRDVGVAAAPAFFGRHRVSASYTPSGSLLASVVHTKYAVHKPHYTPLANGVKFATVVAGTGPGIEVGQTASMLYTGYLAEALTVFDYTDAHGGSPFTFHVQASPEEVIAGFDAATVGMQVGETRIVYIPAAQGYGSAGSSPSIPPNANLVFLIMLVGIS